MELTSQQITHLRETSAAFRSGEEHGRGLGAEEILEAIEYVTSKLTEQQCIILGRYLLHMSDGEDD